MYPTFFRMVPGYRNLNLARCHLVHQFNWTRVGTLKQSDDPRFALCVFCNVNRSAVWMKYNPHSLKYLQIQNIAFSEMRQTFGETRVVAKSLAVRILCEAFQKGIYGENYAWILPGYHRSNWWRDTSEVNCTVEQLAEVVEGHFAVEFSPYSQRFARLTVANKTVLTIRSELEDGRGSAAERVFKGYVYDGLWTLSLAIEEVIRRIGHK
ncbi:unnamed protein product [Gongylonema pulchrum]|uniref:ANF_receptor domain-containing protein n=1 Tax=Gongylonema pulchrum TaxID=637853 RepID=A0A183D4R8_9BILA|nr:unnamed protein product [Gongylonema pulchrum]